MDKALLEAYEAAKTEFKISGFQLYQKTGFSFGEGADSVDYNASQSLFYNENTGENLLRIFYPKEKILAYYEISNIRQVMEAHPDVTALLLQNGLTLYRWENLYLTREKFGKIISIDKWRSKQGKHPADDTVKAFKQNWPFGEAVKDGVSGEIGTIVESYSLEQGCAQHQVSFPSGEKRYFWPCDYIDGRAVFVERQNRDRVQETEEKLKNSIIDAEKNETELSGAYKIYRYWKRGMIGRGE